VLGQQPEHHHAVGHGQGVGVAEVELVLAVAALVVEGVDVPAELVQVGDHGAEERVGQHGRLEVVAPGGGVVGVGGDERPPLAVDLAQHVQLGLDAQLGDQAHGPGRLHLAAQDPAGVVAVGLAVEVQVGRGQGVAGVPGQHGQAVEVGDADALVLVGAELAHALQGADGVELGAGGHVLEVGQGDALGLGDAVDVGVGAEHVADAGRLQPPPGLLHLGHRNLLARLV
jgi:hypothetical protein